MTNTVGSSLAREAEGVLYTHAGPEICVAATKTFATQMVSQYLVALYLAQVRGSMFPEEIAEILARMDELPEQVEQGDRPRRSVSGVGRTVSRMRQPCCSSGVTRGTRPRWRARSSSRRLSYIHAEGFPAGELKHGAIALIEDGVPVVAVATQCHVYPKMLSNIQEVRARGAVVIAVATEGDTQIGGLRRPRAGGARDPGAPLAGGGHRAPAAASRITSRRFAAATSTSPGTSPRASRSSRASRQPGCAP